MRAPGPATQVDPKTPKAVKANKAGRPKRKSDSAASTSSKERMSENSAAAVNLFQTPSKKKLRESPPAREQLDIRTFMTPKGSVKAKSSTESLEATSRDCATAHFDLTLDLDNPTQQTENKEHPLLSSKVYVEVPDTSVDSRSGHQLNFFLFPFFAKLLICLEGKLMTPHRGNTILFHSSQQLPCLRLGPSKGFLS